MPQNGKTNFKNLAARLSDHFMTLCVVVLCYPYNSNCFFDLYMDNIARGLSLYRTNIIAFIARIS